MWITTIQMYKTLFWDRRHFYRTVKVSAKSISTVFGNNFLAFYNLLTLLKIFIKKKIT